MRCAVIIGWWTVVSVSSKPQFVGNVIGSSLPDSFDKYWNQVTPENAGKWGNVEGKQGEYDWRALDVIYAHAKQHQYPVKDHNLVWGNQYPQWLSQLSVANQTSAIEAWVKEVADRYGAESSFIDVVNEPIHTAYPFKAALGGAGATGWDWVLTAYALARKHFPASTRLLINEYGVVSDSGARAKYKELIRLLQERQLVDGIGAQAHCFNVDFMTAQEMTTALDDLATLGLPVFISELDIRGSDADEPSQLAQYQTLFPALYEHRSVAGVTLWGYIEGQTWKEHTGLLNADGSERAALTWLVEEGYLDLASNTTRTVAVNRTNVSPTQLAAAGHKAGQT